MRQIFLLGGRVATAVAALASAASYAAAGDFDPSFNQVGFTRHDLSESALAEGVVIYPSGEIVTLGFYGTDRRPILWRQLPDGTLDTSFGGTGVVYPPIPGANSIPDTIAVDNLNRIIVVGTFGTGYVLWRLNFDGSSDLSFAGTGYFTFSTGASPPYPITGVAIQADNKIVGVGGMLSSRSQFTVYRVTEAGELDSTFGGTGVIFTEITPGGGVDRATGVAIQADGRIVAAGRARSFASLNYQVALARYLPSGELDSDFGEGGKVLFSILDNNLGRKVVIQPDGKIVVTGTTCADLGGDNSYCYFGVARVDGRGALDPTFGAGGKVYTDVGSNGGAAYDLALQSDNRIVVVGQRFVADTPSVVNVALVRYQEDGSLDATFGLGGISETNFGYAENEAFGVGLQPDGKIVVAGFTTRDDSSTWVAVTARYLSQ